MDKIVKRAEKRVKESEKRIESLETEIAELENKIAAGSCDAETLDLYAKRQKDIENEMSVWELSSAELENLTNGAN